MMSNNNNNNNWRSVAANKSAHARPVLPACPVLPSHPPHTACRPHAPSAPLLPPPPLPARPPCRRRHDVLHVPEPAAVNLGRLKAGGQGCAAGVCAGMLGGICIYA